MNPEDQLNNLLNEWHRHSEIAHQGHYDAGIFYDRLFLFLGIPVIVLSAFTGGFEVMTGGSNGPVTGVISLCIAILAGLQTFLKFSQRAERHRHAGARYGGIRRSLEEVKITLSESTKDAKAELHKIKELIDTLAKESPEIPRRIHRKHVSKTIAYHPNQS